MTDHEFDQLVADICTLAPDDETWRLFMICLSDIEDLPEVSE